jgi:hypothetical protein
MILLGDPMGHGVRFTLDDLFRRAGVREPGRLALIDPFNRASVSGGAPPALSFAQADRAISALAGRLRGLGLQTDAVIAIQLPNTIESVIALLGVLRAGMIAALLPALWRKQDIVAALAPIGPKAIIATAAQAEAVMQAAAQLFPIRYVCGFGDDLPDGMVPLDAIFAPDSEPTEPDARPRHGATHVAAITFDVTAAGFVAVARNHGELIAGGIDVTRAARIAQGSNILSAILPGSFAAIALTLVPWLLTGGTLALHHPIDPEYFFAQCEALGECNLVLPGPVLSPLSDAGLLGAPAQTIVALWRAPERLADAPIWHGDAALTDVASFGEIGLVATRRGSDGAPVLNIEPGTVEMARSEAGTLMLRGGMVPTRPFPPGAELGDGPHLAVNKTGFVDTGIPCRIEQKTLVVSGPPAGMVGVGGARFALRALESEVTSLDTTATIVALPDALAGQRLVGAAEDADVVRTELEQRGAHPLVAGAFRPRAVAAR